MESKIELKLRQGIEKLGGRCIKFNVQRANPDRIVMVPAVEGLRGQRGKPITELVELKDYDDPRSNQAIRIAQFQKLGYRVTVLRDSADVEMYLLNLKQRIG